MFLVHCMFSFSSLSLQLAAHIHIKMENLRIKKIVDSHNNLINISSIRVNYEFLGMSVLSSGESLGSFGVSLGWVFLSCLFNFMLLC